MSQRLISGAGGSGKAGGNAARTPVEAADSLRSISYARVLDLIGEGEIEGLANGLQSVYLDGTPIENADGTTNFTGVTLETVNGTQAQAQLHGFGTVESEFAVSLEVTAATPIVRTITNANVDAVRVRLSIPQLSSQNVTNGDLTGTTVRIAVDIQSNGGGFVPQNIGYEWQASATPATLPAIGLQIEADWTAPIIAGPGRTTIYGWVKYDVQYRQVGAGGWTTLKSDSFTTADLRIVGGRGGVVFNRNQTRTYTTPSLPELLYEVRVVQTGGTGTATLKSYRILTPVPYDDITGKTTAGYQRAYRRQLTGSPPWDIRLRRITADSVSVALSNKTFFDSLAELTDEKFSYPNSALVGIRIDASQFNAIPTRGYDMKLLRVKVPDNYDPVSRIYTGNWSGAFVTAWTDNPAWCFYDLLSNTRYGLGKFLPAASIDKWGLYTIGQYCDGMVPDGYGSEEPRFRCNVFLQTQVEAYQAVSNMAAIFRGMAYWAGGQIVGVQDAPADSVYLFTEANVKDGLFSYSGSARNARHTVAYVSWNDPADGYKLKPEYVEDLDGVARYGVVAISLTAFGCASRGQANRLGKWLLYSERLETEVITFQTGQDAAYLRPGAIFSVQDQHRTGIRFGGRITSATATSITIDAPLTIDGAQTYTLQVVLPNGTLDVRTVTNAAGLTEVLTVSAGFTTTPVAPAVWILTSSALSPRLYRALTIVETAKQSYEVTGVEHNASKFDAVELDYDLIVPRVSTLTAIPPTPQNVTISESLAVRQGAVVVVVEIRWDPVPNASRYKVEWRRDKGNYTEIVDLHGTLAEVLNAQPGYYEVRVTARNVLSATSLAGTAGRQIFGKTAKPADVTGFLVSRNGELLVFSWNAVADLDVSHYTIRQGVSWEAGVVVLDRTIASRFQVITHVGGTYLIKAVDTSGNESANAAVIITGDNPNINVVVMQTDSPSWTGVKVSTQGDSEGLTLVNSQRWNTLTNFWNTYTDTWYGMGTWASPGTYETLPIDIGVVLTSRVEVTVVTEQIQVDAPTWQQLTLPWLSYLIPWQGAEDQSSVSYEIATSQDAAAYTAYGPFQNGVYTARAFKFKLTLSTLNSNYLPRVKNFTATIDVPDRILHFEDAAIDIGGTTLVFSPAFVVVQTVTGSLQGATVGDTFTVTNKTTTGATISVYDAAGAPKYGSIDLDVFGYGEI